MDQIINIINGMYMLLGFTLGILITFILIIGGWKIK